MGDRPPVNPRVQISNTLNHRTSSARYPGSDSRPPRYFDRAKRYSGPGGLPYFFLCVVEQEGVETARVECVWSVIWDEIAVGIAAAPANVVAITARATPPRKDLERDSGHFLEALWHGSPFLDAEKRNHQPDSVVVERPDHNVPMTRGL